VRRPVNKFQCGNIRPAGGWLASTSANQLRHDPHRQVVTLSRPTPKGCCDPHPPLLPSPSIGQRIRNSAITATFTFSISLVFFSLLCAARQGLCTPLVTGLECRRNMANSVATANDSVFIRQGNFPLASAAPTATLAVQLSQGWRQQPSLSTRLDAKTRAKQPAEDWQRRQKGKREREKEREKYFHKLRLHVILYLVWCLHNRLMIRRQRETPRSGYPRNKCYTSTTCRRGDTEMKKAIEESRNVHRRKIPSTTFHDWKHVHGYWGHLVLIG
jgi:hypothetical protein